MLRGGDDFLLGVGNRFLAAPFDPLDRDIALLGDDVAANGGEALVAVAAVRRGENLDVISVWRLRKGTSTFPSSRYDEVRCRSHRREGCR